MRRACPDDVPASTALCRRVHGHDRSGELQGAIAAGTARVVERPDRISGYATGFGYGWHAVAEGNKPAGADRVSRHLRQPGDPRALAQRVFAAQVIEPTANVPSGLERPRRLVDGFLRYVEVETFPGGCFFASVLAEVDMHPGAVRDRLVDFLDDWLARLDDAVPQAQADGAIAAAEDSGQLAFEIEAALLLAKAQFVVTRTPLPMQRARRAIERRLAAAGARPPSV